MVWLAVSKLLPGAPLRWFRLWLALGVLLIVLVFYLSLAPLAFPMPREHIDKLYHATTYALMMGWFVQIFRGARSYAILAVAFIAMGVLIEVLQGFQPLRHFDVLDMLANAAGVTLVWLLAATAFPRWLERFEQRYFSGD